MDQFEVYQTIIKTQCDNMWTVAQIGWTQFDLIGMLCIMPKFCLSIDHLS